MPSAFVHINFNSFIYLPHSFTQLNDAVVNSICTPLALRLSITYYLSSELAFFSSVKLEYLLSCLPSDLV